MAKIEIRCERELTDGSKQSTVLKAKDAAQAERYRRTLNIEQRTRYAGTSQTISGRTAG